jgi:competence protein ComEC
LGNSPLIQHLYGRLSSLPAMATAVMAAQSGRLFLWMPVAFGAGSALYLALRFEPGWLILAGALVSAIGLWLAVRMNFGTYLTQSIAIILIFVAGVSVAKLRAERVRAPVMPASGTYIVDALILDVVSTTRDKPKLLLAPIRLKGIRADQTPIKIRVSLRPEALDEGGLRPGQAVHGLMILAAPSGPAYPGGYDFARQAYFEGVGGQGFVPGRLTVYSPPKLNGRLRLITSLNGLRWRISQSIVDKVSKPVGVLPAQEETIGGFAAAMVSGHQAYVSENLLQSMRDSGLAHILSISGLHMAMVGGFSFFFFRGLMAMIPVLALNYPIKKIAAGLAMGFVAAYLVISGAPAPAVRAAVVAWIAFAAILFDRRALSLRALAIAALIVLVMTPEAVIQPGFQMSFAATAALLALAEAQKPSVGEIDVPAWVKMLQKAGTAVGVSLWASLVAGAATAPFTLAFFNRLTPYGLISNLFEAPISTFVIMPALFLGTLMQDTFVGAWLLKLAGLGLIAIRFISDHTAALPGSVIRIASAPPLVAGFAFAGVLIVCLVRGRARWVGLVIALGILVWPRVKPAAVWIDAEGANAAIRQGHQAFALRPEVKLYGYRQWLNHYGLTGINGVPDEDDLPVNGVNGNELSAAYDCKAYVCVPKPSAPYRIGFAFGRKPPKPEALESLCLSSTLVVVRARTVTWPQACNGVNRLAGEDFARLGSMELSRSQGRWLIRASMPLRGQRPWIRPNP